MKLLVLGDYISDVYTYGKALRLCPEAPVPVIIPEKEIHSDGGAGLVFNQLKELGADVQAVYGSESVKYRYFAGSHLICRVNNDSYKVQPIQFGDLPEADAYVVADYGKGGMTSQLAAQIVSTGIPCFVDAKHHWHWYAGGDVTIFPNEHECLDETFTADRVVRKLGKNGCEYFNVHLPATISEVVDVTGAGDIFLAAFVFAATNNLKPENCLRFANAMAGESCRHVGTWTVSQGFAKAYLDRLRAFEESAQQDPDCSRDSNRSEQQQKLSQHRNVGALDPTLGGTLPEYFPGGSVIRLGVSHSPVRAQTLPESPSIPIELSDIGSPLGLEISHTPDTKLQSDWKILNPIEFERLYGHKPAPDQPLLWKRSKLQV